MSRRKSKSLGINNADEHQLRLIALMRQIGHRHRPYTVFTDFVEMSALALSNSVDRRQFEKREARYFEVIKKYSKEELALFPQMFAALVSSFDLRVQAEELTDVLGQVYMSLEIANERSGQFFTPYEISKLMAMMTFSDKGEDIRERGYVRLQEPACGAGGMIIAAAEAMRGQKLNYQTQLHVTAIDIDPVCVHQTYLQLTLLHIPAVIVHGNALTLETWGQWYTPAHVLGGWGWRLRLRDRTGYATKWLPYPLKRPGMGKTYREVQWANSTPATLPAPAEAVETV